MISLVEIKNYCARLASNLRQPKRSWFVWSQLTFATRALDLEEMVEKGCSNYVRESAWCKLYGACCCNKRAQKRLKCTRLPNRPTKCYSYGHERYRFLCRCVAQQNPWFLIINFQCSLITLTNTSCREMWATFEVESVSCFFCFPPWN